MRYCSACQAEVQTVDGYCLLGHEVALEAPIPSLEALREEVDRVFEEARRQVEVLLGSGPTAGPPPARGHAGPPRARPSTPPPPPPPLDPVRAIEDQRRTVFAALQAEEPLTVGDPIVAFAPAPRMDWGPERPGLRRKRGESAS